MNETKVIGARGEEANRFIVVGNGLIGASLRTQFDLRGFDTLSVALRPREQAGTSACDLALESGRIKLRKELSRRRPKLAVLVHGPSDVSWIESHGDEAATIHCGVAQILADASVPALFVSTDNVFAGERGDYTPSDPVSPQNAYGRIKVQAESIYLQTGRALVLRVSLVYGFAPPEHRLNFAEQCLRSAMEAQSFHAPTDQFFTPIHTLDVAEVIAAICGAPAPPTGIRHLAGPVELSRYEFAKMAYRLAGADEALVVPCLRQDTTWASRPEYSSLRCGDFRDISELREWRAMSPESGLKAMITDRRAKELIT